jgi:hypothetical protein
LFLEAFLYIRLQSPSINSRLATPCGSNLAFVRRMSQNFSAEPAGSGTRKKFLRLSRPRSPVNISDTPRSRARRDEPLVVRLPRLRGKREERFAHLLCGTIEQEIPEPDRAATRSATDERIAALETEVARVRQELGHRWKLTGHGDQRSCRDDNRSEQQ